MHALNTTLRIAPQRSRCLGAFWLGLHTLGLIALWVAAVGSGAKLLGAAVLCGTATIGWQRHLRDVRKLVLTWSGDGSWTLYWPGRTPVRCERWSAPWVYPQLVLLRFEVGRWRRLTLALCPDSLPPAQHRALRVGLRLYSPPRRGT